MTIAQALVNYTKAMQSVDTIHRTLSILVSDEWGYEVELFPSGEVGFYIDVKIIRDNGSIHTTQFDQHEFPLNPEKILERRTKIMGEMT